MVQTASHPVELLPTCSMHNTVIDTTLCVPLCLLLGVLPSVLLKGMTENFSGIRTCFLNDNIFNQTDRKPLCKVHHHPYIRTNLELFLKAQDYKQLLQGISLIEIQEAGVAQERKEGQSY